MRKLLCNLFNKYDWVHQFKKAGANQYGRWGRCLFCGKRYYKSKDFRFRYDDYNKPVENIFNYIGEPIHHTLPEDWDKL